MTVRTAAVAKCHHNTSSSTGPKTTAGKTRSSRNARRHGLSVPIESVPELAGQAESLALAFADRMGGSDCLHLIRKVLEAELDILRVRDARRTMVNSISVARSAQRHTSEAMDDEMVDNLLVNEGSQNLVYAEYRLPCPGSQQKIARATAQVLPQLERLDRYEKRALSRRRRAIWILFAEIDRIRSVKHDADEAAVF